MVAKNIVNKLGLSQERIDQQVEELFGTDESRLLEDVLKQKVDSLIPGVILTGTIVSRLGNDVIVEVGLKSEGVLDTSEFESPDEIEPGREIEVLLEEVEAEGGVILLSKRKADRIRGWERIINTKKEGDVVTGRVTRRIKGGLLVDIGVPVFLPASQVDIRKPGDISRFIGKQIQCKILKIDTENHNIVVSRRKLVEEQRLSSKEKLLAEIEVGQLRKGVVKNIADFGAFVDLGGLDGLLHISDLSWGRISHPSEVVGIDQEIECVVVSVDKENERVSLGLKQKMPNPWEDVDKRYPVGARVRGKAVNIMNYGVFVRLEEGVEGLVHISEMSWTKRVTHPADMLNLGDEIEVVVLDVNREKQEISLGMKQTEVNPWTVAAQKYPAGTIVTVKVRSLTNYGAFVEVEPGIDGLVHISDLSWTKKFSHPHEVLQKDQQLECLVLSIDEEKQRISLGVKQLTEDPWLRAIPEKYIPGQIVKGTVTKITNFGVFVELEPGLEGLLHISELADHKIDKPQDVVKTGQEIEIKILRVDSEARKIGLSLRRVQWAAEDEPQTQAAESRKRQAEPPDAQQQQDTVQTDTQQSEQDAAPTNVQEQEQAQTDSAPSDAQQSEQDAAPSDVQEQEQAQTDSAQSDAQQSEQDAAPSDVQEQEHNEKDKQE